MLTLNCGCKGQHSLSGGNTDSQRSVRENGDVMLSAESDNEYDADCTEHVPLL